MKKVLFRLLVFLVAVNLILPLNMISAKEQSLYASMPGFKINLNGIQIDNDFRKYPFLVYKGITYFPMTWYDCRLLGLENEWSSEEGLKVYQSKVTSSYVADTVKAKNSEKRKITIPNMKIQVNGKPVDNSKEEYPLFLYNNITYFPMTWRFAYDEFSWEYSWDNKEGLTIVSSNPQLQKVELPAYATQNDIILFEDYFYFVETKEKECINNVYRVNKSNTLNKELLASYEVSTSYGFNKWLDFQIRDNELWFMYHVGGALMGHDVYYKVNSNGKASMEFSGYLDFMKTQNGILEIYEGVPPEPGNLSLYPHGVIDLNNRKTIGDPSLLYGFSGITTVIEDTVYAMASSYENYDYVEGKKNRLYKVDLNTNETTMLTEFEITSFKISGGRLFYVKNEDGCLYVSDLDGTREARISNNISKIYDYYELDGEIYYLALEEEKKHLFKVEQNKADTKVLEEPIDNIIVDQEKLICKLSTGEDYGVKVLDVEGNLEIAVTDQVDTVFAYEGTLVIVTANDKEVKLIKL